jgi:hypothetical protein
MRIRHAIAFVLLLHSAAAHGAGIVTLSLTSPHNNQTVAPGQRIDWRIEFEVSTGDNAGLALLLVDMVQGVFNPELFDIPPASATPPAMQKFDAPAGFSNVPNGFSGTPLGDIGERNLRQIGGSQNTFGQPGQIMGQDATVAPAVGQSGAVVFAEGFFNAPVSAGNYSFQLESAVANTLDAANAPPAASPVSPAAIIFAELQFSFVVDPAVVVLGDMNCDGNVDQQDVNPFVLAVIDPLAYAVDFPNCDADRANVNGDTAIDGLDVATFVTCLLSSGCP